MHKFQCSALILEPRRLDLRADALFQGDEAVLKALFAFVGVEMPPAKEIEEVLGRRLNAQRRGSFPSPGEWTEAERRAVREGVTAVAASLGYEL